MQTRDLVIYCSIVLIDLHYISIAETPTEGYNSTTVAAIAGVVSVIIIMTVLIAIALVVSHCRKTSVRGNYDTGPREHVCEVYLYKLCAVFVP